VVSKRTNCISTLKPPNCSSTHWTVPTPTRPNLPADCCLVETTLQASLLAPLPI
jgi:hypothetical protein